MSYVVAAYITAIGGITLYAGRLVVRSRQIATALMRQSQDEQPETQ